MRLHRLKLVNFRQHAESELTFGSGLTAVVGPNGAGKTTLLEALAWALYGNVAVRGSRDSLRRHGAPARAPVRVEADFGLGSNEYRIVRSLYGAELYQDGGEGPIANSHAAVSSKVTHLFGMTHGEFFNTYFTGQKELAVMATMGPTDRGKFLSRLLGYEKLRSAQEELRQQRSVLRGQLAGLEQGMEDPQQLEKELKEARGIVDEAEARIGEVENQRSNALVALAEAEPRWTEMVKLREVTLAAEGELKIAEQSVQEARREFERLDRSLAEAISARNQLQEISSDLAQAEALKAELAHLDREAQAAGRKRSLSGQLKEVRDQVERVRQRVGVLAGAEVEYEGAKAALGSAQSGLEDLRQHEEQARTAWVRERQDAETKRLALLDQYKDLQLHRERIVEAGVDGQCPTCARPLGAEYENVLETLKAQLDEIMDNGKYYKARVDQLTGEPDELNAILDDVKSRGKVLDSAMQDLAETEARTVQLHEAKAELGALGGRLGDLENELENLADAYDPDRHDLVRQEMRRITPLIESAAQLKARAEHAERLVFEAERAERTLSEREERVRRQRDAMEASGFSDEAYQRAHEVFHGAEKLLRELELGVATITGDLKAARTRVDGVQHRLQQRNDRAERVTALHSELDMHDELDSVLEDLRGELNGRLRPDLSELGSTFVADLTDGRYHEFELDSQYRINVLEEGVLKSVISGGEEDVFNLALRLAISQMVAERAGQPLSLLVLDEIFGGLDDGRRQGVIVLLQKLADRFPQVLLITHIESVKEGADRVLRVALDQRSGSATVTEELASIEYVDAIV